MIRIPTMIIEDEPPARALLADMLRRYAELELVATAGSSAQALQVLATARPRLVFLDIGMPGPDGMALARQLRGDVRVVFVTAHDDRAVEAFELEALDYLLKPIGPRQLDRAVTRALAALTCAGAVQPGSYARRLPLRENSERIVLQPIEAIEWLEADGKYIIAHAPGQPPRRLRRPMHELAASLDPARFLRVSRSAIVNLDRVREIQPWFHGDWLLITESGAQIQSTRSYREGLERVLGRRSRRGGGS